MCCIFVKLFGIYFLRIPGFWEIRICWPQNNDAYKLWKRTLMKLEANPNPMQEMMAALPLVLKRSTARTRPIHNSTFLCPSPSSLVWTNPNKAKLWATRTITTTDPEVVVGVTEVHKRKTRKYYSYIDENTDDYDDQRRGIVESPQEQVKNAILRLGEVVSCLQP